MSQATRTKQKFPAPFAGLVPASSIRPATSDGVQGSREEMAGAQLARPQTASPSKKQLVRERMRQMEYAEAARRLMVTQTGQAGWIRSPCRRASA